MLNVDESILTKLIVTSIFVLLENTVIILTAWYLPELCDVSFMSKIETCYDFR